MGHRSRRHPGTGTARAPPFVFERIAHWVARLTRFEASWRRHFGRIGVTPLEVAYEELAENYEATVRESTITWDCRTPPTS